MGTFFELCCSILPIRRPAGTDPTALLRWAGSFQGLQSGDLCRISRAQAAITDWPSVEFTLVQARRVPFFSWVGTWQYQTKDHLEHRIAATRWVVDQIRHGADPPTLGDDKYAATRWFDDGPPPKPYPISRWATGSIMEGSSDKAASEGRFEEALSLARNYILGPAETPRYALPFCVIAKYQISYDDLVGARRTLSEAFDVAMKSPKSNFAMGSPRDEGLCAIATLLPDAGDVERAEQVFAMLRGLKQKAARDFAVFYGRNSDPSNAVRMLLRIRDDKDRAKATVDVVRTLINEPNNQTKWPYDPNRFVQLYDYAMATAKKAGGSIPPGNE